MKYIISGYQGTFSSDDDGADKLIVTSAGQLDSITLGSNGAWTATIGGLVQGSITLAQGNDSDSKITIGRTGLVQASIDLRRNATLNNSGQIISNVGIYLDEGDRHVIKNTGTIIGSSFSIVIGSGSSADNVINSGTLKGDVGLGEGKDSITNSGRIFGNVKLGEGDDTFTNYRGRKSGFVTGYIDLGDGNDTFRGGKYAETIDGGAGNDTINLGGGDDTYYASYTAADGGSTNTIKGGAGIDTYRIDDSSLLTGSIINLDKIAHTDAPYVRCQCEGQYRHRDSRKRRSRQDNR